MEMFKMWSENSRVVSLTPKSAGKHSKVSLNELNLLDLTCMFEALTGKWPDYRLKFGEAGLDPKFCTTNWFCIQIVTRITVCMRNKSDKIQLDLWSSRNAVHRLRSECLRCSLWGDNAMMSNVKWQLKTPSLLWNPKFGLNLRKFNLLQEPPTPSRSSLHFLVCFLRGVLTRSSHKKFLQEVLVYKVRTADWTVRSHWPLSFKLSVARI